MNMNQLIEKSEINYHLPINPEARQTLKRLCSLIVDECIEAIKDADERHAFTTYDKGVIGSTKERCIKNLRERLEV